eukprot:m.19389 g.19389  ORF g.19389 m.19389 type:complete len:1907 (+) comp5931_c0_seq1:735-6455(+)
MTRQLRPRVPWLALVVVLGVGSSVRATTHVVEWSRTSGSTFLSNKPRTDEIMFINNANEADGDIMVISSDPISNAGVCKGLSVFHKLAYGANITVPLAGVETTATFVADIGDAELTVTIGSPESTVCPVGYRHVGQCVNRFLPSDVVEAMDSCRSRSQGTCSAMSGCVYHDDTGTCAFTCGTGQLTTFEECTSTSLCHWESCVATDCSSLDNQVATVGMVCSMYNITGVMDSCDSQLLAPGCTLLGTTGKCSARQVRQPDYGFTEVAGCSVKRSQCDSDWQCTAALFAVAQEHGTNNGCNNECRNAHEPRDANSRQLYWTLLLCLDPGHSSLSTCEKECYEENSRCLANTQCATARESWLGTSVKDCYTLECRNHHRPSDIYAHHLYSKFVGCRIQCAKDQGMCGQCPETVETCSDGIKNQGETGIDCGGQCSACGSCSNGLWDPSEIEVDCGGPCGDCPFSIPLFPVGMVATPSTIDLSVGDLVAVTGHPEVSYTFTSKEVADCPIEPCTDTVCGALFSSGPLSSKDSFNFQVQGAGEYVSSSEGAELEVSFRVNPPSTSCPSGMVAMNECQQDRSQSAYDPCQSISNPTSTTCGANQGCEIEERNECVASSCDQASVSECDIYPHCSFDGHHCVSNSHSAPACGSELTQSSCESITGCEWPPDNCKRACSPFKSEGDCNGAQGCSWYGCVAANCSVGVVDPMPSCTSLGDDGAAVDHDAYRPCNSRLLNRGCHYHDNDNPNRPNQCVKDHWRSDDSSDGGDSSGGGGSGCASQTCATSFAACLAETDGCAIALNNATATLSAKGGVASCGAACRLSFLDVVPESKSLDVSLEFFGCFWSCTDATCDDADFCPNLKSACDSDQECATATECVQGCDQADTSAQSQESCRTTCLEALESSESLYWALTYCVDRECKQGTCNELLAYTREPNSYSVQVSSHMEMYPPTHIQSIMNSTPPSTVDVQASSSAMKVVSTGDIVASNFGPMQFAEDGLQKAFWTDDDNRVLVCIEDRGDHCQHICAAEFAACKKYRTCSSALDTMGDITKISGGIANCDSSCVLRATPSTFSASSREAFFELYACSRGCWLDTEICPGEFNCLQTSETCSTDAVCQSFRGDLCLDCDDVMSFIDSNSAKTNQALVSLGTCMKLALTCPPDVTAYPDNGRLTASVSETYTATYYKGRMASTWFTKDARRVTSQPSTADAPCDSTHVGAVKESFPIGDTAVFVSVYTDDGLQAECSFHVNIKTTATINLLQNIGTSITASNFSRISEADDAATRLHNASKDAKTFTATDINLMADNLQEFVGTGSKQLFVNNEDLTSNTTLTLVRVFDNLLNAQRNQAVTSETTNQGSKRIRASNRQMVSQMAAAVELKGGANKTVVEFDEPLVKLRVTKAKGSSFDGEEFEDAPTNSRFRVPKEVAASCGGDFPIVFQALRSSVWYATTTNITVASSIVSCTLPTCTLPAVMDPPFEFHSPKSEGTCYFFDVDTDKWSTEGVTTERTDDTIICKSTHLTSFAVLVDSSGAASGDHAEALSHLTLILSAISLVALFATIVVHSGFRRLRALVPSKILLGLAVSLFIALLLFIVASEAASTVSKSTCQSLAVLLHYFWLSAAAWMLVQGANLYAVTVIVLGLNMERRVVVYNIVAWGVPAVIVAITVGVAGADKYGDESFCWINDSNTLVGAFLAPLAVMLLANFVFFGFIFRAIEQSSSRARRRSSGSSSDEIRNLKQKLGEARAAVSLVFLLGLGWIFGALIDTGDTASSVTFQYLFAIFATGQGLALFVFYCLLNPKVKEEYRRSVGSESRSSVAKSLKKTKRTGESSSSEAKKSWVADGFSTASLGTSTVDSETGLIPHHTDNPYQEGPFPDYGEENTLEARRGTGASYLEMAEQPSDLTPINNRLDDVP